MWWTEEQTTYCGIVVELCRSSLDEFLSDYNYKKQDLPWGLRLRFFNEIADALAYLHNHNPNKSVIHGDLKPTNIFLTNDLTVKLGDLESTRIKKQLKVTSWQALLDINQEYTSLYTAQEFREDSLEKTYSMDIYR